MASAQKAVVVVGSLHYDIMIDAPHRPAKGETVAGYRWYPKFGGKGGNQAVAAARFGCPTRMVGAVGGDGFAPFLRESLERAGVAHDFVEARGDSASGMSVAIADAQGDYGAVIVSGVNLEIDPGRLDDRAIWENAAILVLQNEVTEALNVAAAERARTAGMKTCLNAAPARPVGGRLKALIDILVVNAVEAQAMSGMEVRDLATAEAAAAELAKAFGTAVVTAGGAGAAACTLQGERFSVPGRQVRLVSTHGAGDVFTGTLCAALACGHELNKAMQLANDSAARHVSAPIRDTSAAAV